ncbi:MAG TPA: XisI protein [Thiotrichaceae bacterium]|nr:XisI protein [Thiotrichaceae bacterium]
MDKLNQYREIIKALLHDYAQYQPAVGDIEIEVIIDEEHDHYELIHTGWHEAYRIHGSVIHIDIRHQKIWIQYDGTEGGIANELVEAGIPHDQIVLAFKHPHIRPHTDFATH